MGSLGWKSFGFFEQEVKNIGHDVAEILGQVTAVWHEKSDETKSHDDRKGSMWLGLSNGLIQQIDSSLQPLKVFPAVSGRIWAMASWKNSLIVLGEEGVQDGQRFVVKCWDISDQSFSVTPPEIASSNLFSSMKIPEGRIESMGIHCSQWPTVYVVAGTSTGAIHVYSGDVVKGKFGMPYGCHIIDKGIKGRKSVMDIHFMKKNTALYVYAVTETSVVGMDIHLGQVLMEDDVGAPKNCSTVTGKGELVICGRDGLFYYTIDDGRTVAASMAGDKKMIQATGQYVVLISSGEPTSENEVIKILDVPKKLVVGNFSTGRTGYSILSAKLEGHADILVRDNGNKVIVLKEKSLRERIQALCKSRAFNLALKTCEENGNDSSIRSDINMLYGDYLCNKRDFEKATDAYIETIDHLETSYVIQKLLDAQRVSNLATYLQALHDKGLATGDHTSLLLHCFVKNKDTDGIKSFVERICSLKGTENYSFDSAAAIEVLQRNGFTDHALKLAEVYNEDDLYLSLLLYDCHDYKKALEYLKKKSRAEASKNLKKYGQVLVKEEPVGTTALLMELCLPVESGPADEYVADLAEFSQFYSENPEDLRYACEAILAMGDPNLPSRKSLYHTLLDLYLSGRGGPRSSSTETKTNSDIDAAMDLLKRGWIAGHEPVYNADVAITMCRLHSFNEGLVFLYMMLRNYRDAASVMCDIKDWDALLALCEKHGDDSLGGDSQLWHLALSRVSSPAAAGPHTEAALRQLLVLIDRHNALPPLTVLPILAKNPHLQLGLVKEYVMKLLESERAAINEDSEEIARIEKEIEAHEVAIKNLENEPQVFQATKDSQTGAPLEIPTVHFLCGHSFNLRTLGDPDDPKCPLCEPEHKRIQEIQRSFLATAMDRDSFFRQLKASEDGFAFIAQAFGKGIVNYNPGNTKSMRH